jgi:hypothetical protein
MTLPLSAATDVEVDDCELELELDTEGCVEVSTARTGKDPLAADEAREGAADTAIAFDLDCTNFKDDNICHQCKQSQHCKLIKLIHNCVSPCFLFLMFAPFSLTHTHTHT